MKKNAFCLIFAFIPFVFACNQSSKTANSAVNDKQDSLIYKTCYGSIYENDFAQLELSTFSSGKVKGTLLVNYEKKPQNNGAIEGKFHGDTLLVDYRFKTGEDTVSVFTNPLAFLKKDGKLMMGVGQIETTLGKSYFVKGKPINFEAGKFTFEPKDCK